MSMNPVARVKLDKDLHLTDDNGPFVIPTGSVVFLNQDGHVISQTFAKRIADKLPLYYSLREAINSITLQTPQANTLRSAKKFADCGAGRERNPQTNRCRKIRTSPSQTVKSTYIDPNDYFGTKDILTKAYRDGKISDQELDRAFVSLEDQAIPQDILDKLEDRQSSNFYSPESSNSSIEFPETKQYERSKVHFPTNRNQTKKMMIPLKDQYDILGQCFFKFFVKGKFVVQGKIRDIQLRDISCNIDQNTLLTLRPLAKELGIKQYYKMSKGDLVNEISKHLEFETARETDAYERNLKLRMAKNYKSY